MDFFSFVFHTKNESQNRCKIPNERDRVTTLLLAAATANIAQQFGTKYIIKSPRSHVFSVLIV